MKIDQVSECIVLMSDGLSVVLGDMYLLHTIY